MMFFRALLVASSFLIALGVSEVLLSRFGPASLLPYQYPRGYHVADPDAGYRLARNFPETIVISRGGTRDLCVTNSLGVRDIEIPPGQDPKKIVLIIGASLTYGWGATRLEETWPRALNQEIDERFPHARGFHFVNAGVSGYNHFQAVELYRKLLQETEAGFAIIVHNAALFNRNRWGPDGMYSVLNDTIMLAQFEETLRRGPFLFLGAPRIIPVHDFLLEASNVYFYLSCYLARRVEDAPPKLVYDDKKEALRDALAQFKAVSLEHGVTAMVAYVPTVWSSGFLRSVGSRQVAEGLGLPYLDPLETMRTLVPRNVRLVMTHGRDTHYSPRGNGIYAKALAPLVVEHLR